MSNKISELIENNLPVDMGFLLLESFYSDESKAQTKEKQAKLTRTKTCQTATQPTKQLNRAQTKNSFLTKTVKDTTTKHLKLKQKPSLPSTHSLTDQLCLKLQQIQKSQQLSKKQFLTQINSLTKKISQVQFRNVTLDVEVHILKTQLGQSLKLVQQLNERLKKVDDLEQRQRAAKRKIERQSYHQVEGSIRRNVRTSGHQRFRSVGEEIHIQRFPYC